jgi:hypothetical protein
MTIFDRVNMRVVAVGAGLCGVAMALSPDAAAVPLVTGGYECIQTSSGDAAGALPAGSACSPASAPLNEMAGVPMALPGPVPVGVPPVPPVPVGVPPVPVGVPPVPPVPVGVPPVPPVPAGVPPVPVGLPPVPVGAPVGAPVPAGAPLPVGAPLTEMSGTGKGVPSAPPPAGAPVAGQPILPGPTG